MRNFGNSPFFNTTTSKHYTVETKTTHKLQNKTPQQMCDSCLIRQQKSVILYCRCDHW